MFDMVTLVEMLGDKCPVQLKVFVYIISHTNLDYYYYGSYKKIAKETGVSVSTVIRAMKKLIDLKLVIHEDRAIWRLNDKYSTLITAEELEQMPKEEAEKYVVTSVKVS